MKRVKEEIQYLKDHCEKIWSGKSEETEEKCRNLLDFINDDTKSKYRMFSATIHYFATGEGHMTAFVAQAAYSKREFLEFLIQKMEGYWYVIGANVYEGMPVNDPIYDQIFSDDMKNVHGNLQHFEAFYHQYFNLS